MTCSESEESLIFSGQNLAFFGIVSETNVPDIYTIRCHSVLDTSSPSLFLQNSLVASGKLAYTTKPIRAFLVLLLNNMMSLPKIVSFIFFCSMVISTQGQDLPKHLWKNRILLVLTGDTLSPDYTKQLEEIITDPEGVVERKLIVYLVTPSSYKEGISNGPWIQSQKLYKRFHQPGNPLEVVLIGLDGSVKHQTQSLTPLIQVFAWIDSMPMRSQEIRRKQATGN